MGYKPSWVIWCQIYLGRRKVVVLFNLPGKISGVHAFPKSMSLKVNVIVWLEFELVYYDVAVRHGDSPLVGKVFSEKSHMKWDLRNKFI